MCQAEGIAEEVRTFDDRAVLAGHLNFSDTNNSNHPLDADVQNNGNDNERNNTDENNGAEAGMAYDGNTTVGGETNNGDNDAPGEERQLILKARRFFRKKLRPIVLGVNGADIVTA